MYFALDQLGYKTWHSMHLLDNGLILNSQFDDIWKPSVDSGKLRPGHLDFELITSLGYNATSDLPMGLYYEQVMEEYPNAKFILTTRRDPEIWFESIDNLLLVSLNAGSLISIKSAMVQKMTAYFRWMHAAFTGDDTYLTRPWPFPRMDKESAIGSYLEHNRRVREIVPADRLLDFKFEGGWQPLCEFLEVEDCPIDRPFPRANSKATFTAMIVSATMTASAILGTLTILELVAIYLVSKMLLRMLGRLGRKGKNKLKPL